MPTNDIHPIILFEDEVIAAGESAEIVVNLDAYKPVGNYALELTLTGSGTAKGEWLIPANGTYVVPTDESDIFTGATAGNDVFSYSPILSQKAKIRITETGDTDSVTVTARLLVQ